MICHLFVSNRLATPTSCQYFIPLIIALLDKPSRREANFRANWIGFEIPDAFVVGYGIDFAQRNRSLPYIGKVRFTDQ